MKNGRLATYRGKCDFAAARRARELGRHVTRSRQRAGWLMATARGKTRNSQDEGKHASHIRTL